MALRKLLGEIDRTLKAVTVGVETFESTFEKLGHAGNPTAKDKLENDLKTQIKKLQRMRDQIKAWLGNSDIKDKTTLLDARKLIETQMERFKALEKEMKMKAFSKEGLSTVSRLDPAEKAKRDMVDWCGTTTDSLSLQIEQTEAEVESLQATAGKKKKAQADRLAELEELNERRQWHIGRLEVVQRMLENGQLQPEQVETIQEDVNYFLDANSEEDFDYDQGIYDDLNLLEDEDMVPEFTPHDELSNFDTSSVIDASDAPPVPPIPAVVAPPPGPKTPAKEEKTATKEKSTSKKEAAATASVDEPPSPVLAKKTPSRKPTIDNTKVETPAKLASTKQPSMDAVPTSSTISAPPSASKPVSLPPIRYAAAAAAAVAPASVPSVPAPTPAAVPAATSASAPSPVSETPAEQAKKEESGTGAMVGSAVDLTESPSSGPMDTQQSNGHAPPPPPGLAGSAQTGLALPPSAGQSYSTASPVSNGLSPNMAAGSAANASTTSPQPGPPGFSNHAESSRAGQAAAAGSFTSPGAQQGVLGNLMHSFDIARELSAEAGAEGHQAAEAVMRMLDESWATAPPARDAQPPNYYRPRNPIKTPSYYPQTRPPILQSKELHQHFDQDQCFYWFYFHPGTQEQWIAAQELKKQNWRFHVQYLTWFKRSSAPQAVTDDYEQGGYYYFDWEQSWFMRRKSDFRFEYRWLSDH